MTKKPVYVTRPSLAPLEEFVPYLEQIWESGVMTHNGPLLQRLERELSEYLGVPDTVCVANGTCAMQLAIRSLDLDGEIITTPFTFIATANIIAWERCTPVFVDIDPSTWNINPDLIEGAITEKTVAIMPVHVFSAPCDVVRIQRIADKHNLKVIYDAAHAMCVEVNGKSIMSYGDVSCTSFHATKLFNTCEGGACFSNAPEIMGRIRRMRFFGFDEQKEISDDGMNAKMTEIAAALGLANLARLGDVCADRRRKYELYRGLLSECSHVSFQTYHETSYNYSYMPILLDSETRLSSVSSRLASKSVFARRYFFPALNTVDRFTGRHLPVVTDLSQRILCLPLYADLRDDKIELIANEIRAGQTG